MSKPEDNDLPNIDPRLASILGAIPSDYGEAPTTPPGFAVTGGGGAPPPPQRREGAPATPASAVSSGATPGGAVPSQDDISAEIKFEAIEVDTPRPADRPAPPPENRPGSATLGKLLAMGQEGAGGEPSEAIPGSGHNPLGSETSAGEGEAGLQAAPPAKPEERAAVAAASGAIPAMPDQEVAIDVMVDEGEPTPPPIGAQSDRVAPAGPPPVPLSVAVVTSGRMTAPVPLSTPVVTARPDDARSDGEATAPPIPVLAPSVPQPVAPVASGPVAVRLNVPPSAPHAVPPPPPVAASPAMESAKPVVLGATSGPVPVPANGGSSGRASVGTMVSPPAPPSAAGVSETGPIRRATSPVGVLLGSAVMKTPPPIAPAELPAAALEPPPVVASAPAAAQPSSEQRGSSDEVPFEELEIVDAPAVGEPVRSEAAASAPPPPPARHAPPPPPQSAAAPRTVVPIPPLPALPEPLAQRPRRRKRSKPWFEEIFDEDYLRTLPFMTAEQTVREVTFIEESLALKPGATVLDVGCGYGRHAIELVQRGLEVTGLDLSLPLLIRAADESQRRSMSVNYVHADMREMAFESRFDAAYSMLTTFGYFDEDSNLKVAQGIARALKPGGRFLLDTINRDYIVGNLPTRIWWEGDGCVVLEEVDFNFHTSRLVTRRSVVFEDGRQLEQEISIRCYSLHELGKLLRQAGFRVLDVSGSLATHGRFFGAASRNIIVLAEKRVD